MTEKPYCEDMAKSYLPTLRSIIARKLINDYNLSQVQVAERLGTTQAAVSQYLSSKRGSKTRELEENLKLHKQIQKITEEIAINGQPTVFSEQICDFCKLLQSIRKNLP